MYINEMPFGTWTAEAERRGRSLVNAIEDGKTLYDKWYQISYGKTNAEIIDLVMFQGKTEEDVQALAYAIGVFKDMYDALHGVNTLIQADRKGYLTPIL